MNVCRPDGRHGCFFGPVIKRAIDRRFVFYRASIAFCTPTKAACQGKPLIPLYLIQEGVKSIRNRNIKIQLWLNRAEARNLQEKARRSRLSVAAYLRHLINGVVPKEAPPPDFFTMMRELHYIGNNLNQIAMKAHALNVIDAKHYDDSVLLFEEAVQKILSAVLDPVPMKH